MRARPGRRAKGALFLLAAMVAGAAAAQLPVDESGRHDPAFHCPPAPSAAPDFREAIAWLAYPRFGVLVPVLEGTEEEQLVHAAGLVEGTALPGVPADRRRNCVIAAHRTSFFSPLESAVPGDVVVLITGSGAEDFVIDRILTVTPDHVELESPTRERRLTLVTCTPFNYLGSAPRRLVVLASPRAGPRRRHGRGTAARAAKKPASK